MKAVVVGASSGLGRCIAVGLGRAGARVALLARRHDKLVAAAAEAGADAVAIECDVTDEAACRGAIEKAAGSLGGIDGLVYASGVATLARLVDTDAQVWERTLATNVTGAALITAAAVPYLAESRGVAAYLSSVSASMTAPWPGLGAYVASKAALERLIEAWAVEHPTVGFTRVTVGDCVGGEGDGMVQFTSAWDADLFADLAQEWSRRGLLSPSLVDVDDLVRVVHTVLELGASAAVPAVAVVPRPSR